MFYISEYLLVFFFVMLIILFMLPMKIRRNHAIFLWYLFIVALAIFSFYAEPSATDDLYRYYYLINRFRHGEAHLIDSPMLVYQLLIWIISLTSHNEYLPILTVILFGYFVGKIIKYHLVADYISSKSYVLYILAVIGGCSVFFIISGIRCALACAIWGYAYSVFGQEKRKYYLLSIVASLLHLIGIVLVIIVAVYKLLNKRESKKGLLALLGALLVISIFVNTTIVSNIIQLFGGSSLWNMIVLKWNEYKLRTFADGNIVKQVCRIFVLIYYLFLFLFLRKKTRKHHGIFIFMILVIFAGIGMPIFLERIPYVVGILSMPLLEDLSKDNRKDVRFIIQVVGFILLSVQVYLGFYEMFAHIQFNGINFHNFLLWNIRN